MGVSSRGIGRRAFLNTSWGLVASAASLSAGFAQPADAPVKIGSTLALTGPLAQTGLIHKIAGDAFVAETNRAGGLLGRKLEWILLDDQSKPELARTLYERLITVDKVDLLIGPYATGAILAVTPVAERYGKILVSSTFGIPKLSKYKGHFPAWPLGPKPEETIPALVFDTFSAAGKSPATIAIVTSKFPSVQFIAAGARDVAKTRGIAEKLYLEFEFGTRDFGPIAARIRDADPDLIFAGAIGLEGNMLLEALDKLNYAPRNHFYVYPSPGPLASSPLGSGALATALFEDLPPLNQSDTAKTFVADYRAGAARANLPYQEADTQGAATFSALQILTTAVKATGGLDDKAIAAWLRGHRVDTLVGLARFDGPGNYGDDLDKLKQVQNGKWVIVAPKAFATPGTSIIVK